MNFFRQYLPELLLSLVCLPALTLSLIGRVFGFGIEETLFDFYKLFSSNQFFLPIVALFTCIGFLVFKKDYLSAKILTFYTGYVLIGLYTYALVLQWIFSSVSRGRVVLSSIRLTELDHLLFHSYLYFDLHKIFSATQEYFAVEAYWLLPTLIPIAAILILVFGCKDFRKFIFAMLLISLISLPIWWVFPATSPSGFLRANIFQMKFPRAIVEARSGSTLTPYMVSQLDMLRDLWIEPNNGYMNVSTIPSLHAGYGFLLLLFLARLRRYTLFLTLPWFVLNIIGAVYIEQHYGLDIIAGILLAAIIYWISLKIFVKREPIPLPKLLHSL